MKTVLQVDSSEGLRNLIRRVKSGQIGALYQGSFVNAFASMVGHYPWVSFCFMLGFSVLQSRS